MSLILGTIGAIILAVAWIPETAQIIRERRSKLNKKFAALYLFGTFLLLLYALMIRDAVFAFVNLIIFLQVSVSIYYSSRPARKKRRR
jgi:lipid-A-disaccharide synthase-like uncharacterized protein